VSNPRQAIRGDSKVQIAPTRLPAYYRRNSECDLHHPSLDLVPVSMHERFTPLERVTLPSVNRAVERGCCDVLGIFTGVEDNPPRNGRSSHL
jgi:hypothetical protein